MDFDKVVKKLLRNEGKIITLDEVSRVVTPEVDEDSKARKKASVYKTIYRLRSLGVLLPLKNGLYYIQSGHIFSPSDVLDNEYWQIVVKVSRECSGWNYFITGTKALELLLKDYSVPKMLVIHTRDVRKRVVLAKGCILECKSVLSGSKTQHKNMYAGLTKFTRKITVGKFSKVSVADPELALMDSLIEREARNGSIEWILIKFLDRYGKTLRRDVLGKLVSLRYITSINRLKLFANNHNLDSIASLCLDIIKKEGGNCFVSAKKSSMKQG